jgi:hypothetical protein
MDVAKGEREILHLKISKEHFLGEDLIHIEFKEIFQVFNQDALDKSLVSSVSDSFISIIIKSLAQLILCM